MRRLACILLVACAAHSARADGARVTVDELGASARALGMATTGAADGADPAGAVLNPALAAGTGDAVRYLSGYANWSGDVDYFANTLVVSRRRGALRGGAVFTHRRLDFKAFDPAYGYYPNNNQASRMTVSAAASYLGSYAALALGASIGWDTSEHGDGPTVAGVGVRAAAPPLERGRFRVDAALAWSALDLGRGDTRTDPNPVSNFTPLAAPERRRLGASVRVALERRGDDELLSLTVNADAVGVCGTGDAIDASAIGAELTVARTLRLRAGTGDALVRGHDAVALSAGLGRAFGAFSCRLDYARVETRDDVLSANVFGADLSYRF